VKGTRCRTWVSVGALAILAIAGIARADSPYSYSNYRPQVVIISIDGLRADALSADRTPNIFALGKRGSYTLNAQTSTIPQTLPNHASMLSGVTPSVHKMTWDDYRADKPSIAVPTVLSSASTLGLQTVMVVGKRKLQHLAPPSAVFVLTERGDVSVANEAIVRAGLPFDLLFVHFPDVDLKGHARNWMSSEYIAQLTATDASVGRLLAALPPAAVVILTADHGGLGNDHAAVCREDTTIPWIIAGPGIRSGHAIQGAINTVDTASTVAAILGISMPSSITGRAAAEVFVPIPDVVPSDLPAY
jgi:predicted AlkP superfamily pyrophosphatase or phosphodiesterase